MRKPLEMGIIHNSCLAHRQQMGENYHTMGGIGSDNEY